MPPVDTAATEVFTRIPDTLAVLRKGGVYRQCEVYAFDGFVFAKSSGGYVKLRISETSNGMLVERVISSRVFRADKLGYLLSEG